jgi:hypothetical protein
MSNPNPWEARLAKAWKGRLLSLSDLARMDGYVLARALANVIQAPDAESQRLHILCYCAISTKLSRQMEMKAALAELPNLRAELTMLKAQLAAKNGHGLTHTAN